MKIYVASSWRNEQQQGVIDALRDAGHEVYDFKNPREGDHVFKWSEIDLEWESWGPIEYLDALIHPIAEAGYGSDFDAMQWADAFVGVHPFGRSASMKMGWAVGQGKKTVLILADAEPELMVKMFDHIVTSVEEAVDVLKGE